MLWAHVRERGALAKIGMALLVGLYWILVSSLVYSCVFVTIAGIWIWVIYTQSRRHRIRDARSTLATRDQHVGSGELERGLQAPGPCWVPPGRVGHYARLGGPIRGQGRGLGSKGRCHAVSRPARQGIPSWWWYREASGGERVPEIPRGAIAKLLPYQDHVVGAPGVAMGRGRSGRVA